MEDEDSITGIRCGACGREIVDEAPCVCGAELDLPRRRTLQRAIARDAIKIIRRLVVELDGFGLARADDMANLGRALIADFERWEDDLPEQPSRLKQLQSASEWRTLVAELVGERPRGT